MSSIGFVGPLKDVDAFKSFAAEVNGGKKAEYVESRRRLGIEKERVFLMQTPMGPMVSVYTEGLNVGFMMARLRASSAAYDKGFIQALTKMSGVNLTELPAGPPPHLAFE